MIFSNDLEPTLNGWIGQRRENTMYHYEYVTRNEAKPYREEIEEIIHEVQNLIRNDFTFSYRFIGSSSRNMITFDSKTNKGFDFDVNIYVNDNEELFSAKEIKHIIKSAIDKVAMKKGFKHCEDSTRVITIKKLSFQKPVIEYSCDFAIVNKYEDAKGFIKEQYIHYQKEQNKYFWDNQTSGYHLEEKSEWIKENMLFNEVRNLYLNKKNNNEILDKKSRALYAETINDIYMKHH